MFNNLKRHITQLQFSSYNNLKNHLTQLQRSHKVTFNPCFYLHAFTQRNSSSYQNVEGSIDTNASIDDIFSQNTSLAQKTDNILHQLALRIQGENSTHRIIDLNLTHVHELLDEWFHYVKNSKPISIGGSHRGIEAAKKAEALLSALEKNHDYLTSIEDGQKPHSFQKLFKNSTLPLVPDECTYNLVCRVYASCDGGREAAIRAESILLRMIQRKFFHNSTVSGWTPPAPNTITFNSVLNAWAKSENCGNECEQSFRNMERYSYIQSSSQDSNSISDHVVRPNVRSLSAVVEAWSNSHVDYGSDRAVAILETAIEKWIHRSTNEGSQDNQCPYVIKPNNYLIHQTLNALAKSNKGYSAAQKAEKILHLISTLEENGQVQLDSVTNESESDVLGLDTRTMTLILECWANCMTDDDIIPAENAENILNEMEKMYSKGKNVKPNNITYTSCILAWARTNTMQAPEKAESILNRLIRSYEESNDEDLRPTSMAFSACIHSYARSRRSDSCIRALEILQRLKPFGNADTLTYNTLLNVCSKSQDRKESNKLALQLWDSMGDCGVEKDSVTYSTLIDTITRDGETECIEMAIDLLEQMIDQWKSGKSHLKPSILSFTDILNGYAKSSQSKKSEKAHKIFQRALELSNIQGSEIKPDVRFFSTFINVCANETGDVADRRMALTSALQAFELFSSNTDQYGKPNHYTFSALLKACGRLAEDIPERSRLLERVFTQCRNEKQVSKSVVYRIQRAFPKSLRLKLLKDCKDMNGSLIVPEAWYDNVPMRDRP